MSSSSYSTPFGAGLAKLAGAFTPSAQRQLLSARAEGVQSRNLANTLLAQDRQFDLDRKRHAFETLQGRLTADPQNVDLQNQLIGAELQKNKDFASALSAYAQEAERVKSVNNIRRANPQIGLPSINGVTQPNIPIADLLGQGQTASSIGSLGLTPSAQGANVALEADRTASANLDTHKLANIQQLEKALKNIHHPLKNASGEVISDVPLSPLASDPKALTDFLANNPKLAKIVAELGLVEDKALNQQMKNTVGMATMQPEINTVYNKNTKSIYDAKISMKKYDLLEKTFADKVGYEGAKNMVERIKAQTKLIESTRGEVKSFERLDDGTLVARGVAGDGSPFQEEVNMNGVPKIPKGNIVITGEKGNEEIVFLQPTELDKGPGGKTVVGDRKSRSKIAMIRDANKKVVDMAVLLKKHGSELTGTGGFIQGMKEVASAVFNLPATNAKGKRIDYKAQFEQLGRELRLNVAPFILQQPGSKISDKDMDRVRNVSKTGSLGTGITEIQDTISIFHKALANINEGEQANNPPPQGVTAVNPKFDGVSDDDLISGFLNKK